MEKELARRLAVIMFTDIQGYTALMQRDERKGLEMRARHRKIFQASTLRFNGKIIQYFGDGTLSTFDSVVDAVKCSIEMQLEFKKEPVVPLRVGIHLGDIVLTKDEVVGDAVNVASRIESMALVGCVLISDRVQRDLGNQNEIQTQSMGLYEMKNVEKPMEIFAIANPGMVVPQGNLISEKAKLHQQNTSIQQSGSGANSETRELMILETPDPEQRQQEVTLNGPTGAGTTQVTVGAGKKKTSWNYVTSFAVIIGIIGSLAVTFNIIKENISPPVEKATQLTVYVHGPGGPQDMVLENSGEVIIDLNGDRRTAQIGENGRTIFTEIPRKFEGQKLPISVQSEGFEVAQPNAEYEWNNEAIYIPVQVSGELLEIKGIVKNADGTALLENTLVIIENEFSTTTDNLGRFSYKLKEDQLREKYDLTLQKEGYQPLNEYYYPNSSGEFRMKKN